MATCVSYSVPRDDDAISVTSDCTLPDAAAIGFGAPLERMSYDDYAKGFDSYGSYASSYYPSCDQLASDCHSECECDDHGVELTRHAVFYDEHDDDDEDPLSPCESSSSSLSDYFHQRRLSNAGDLAGVEHCDTPKVRSKVRRASPH